MLVEKWRAHDMDTVMHYWVEAYKLPKGEEIAHFEWFYDPSKQKVVVRMVVQLKEKLK